MAKLKTPGPGFVTVAELARELGVSRQAIDKAIRSGRLQAYDIDGRPIRADGTRPRHHKPVSRASEAPRTGEVPSPARGWWYRMKIEGRRWHFSAVDDLTAEEKGDVVHEISLAMISPPRPLAERKRVAIRQALALFEGSRSGRARLLEGAWKSYISNGWKRESDMESLAYPRSIERALLHRITRLNGGRSLGWRQIDRIAGPL
jgi:excisionase family DNA binding protein